ncbi:MAG: hypothetical protein AAGG46_09765, partial [Planctomycetota bacterium]
MPDSIWVDLGMPVQKTEDGRLYKPLFAILVQDMDGRLNLNAHGTTEHFASPNLDRSNDGGNQILANLALSEAGLAAAIANQTDGSFLRTSGQLPRGSGWGTPEITLRPVLGLPFGGTQGSVESDSYARLFGGRAVSNPNSVADAVENPAPYGRYGSFPRGGGAFGGGLAPTATFDEVTFNTFTLDQRAGFEFYDHPSLDPLAVARARTTQAFTGDEQAFVANTDGDQPSGFGTMPDLSGAYGVGVDHAGRPVSESANDYLRSATTFPEALTIDTPYEFNLMNGSRRGLPADPYTALGANDDAPFTVAELERLLRAYDADAGRLPDRLWELVDDFDPNKLAITVAAESGSITGYFASDGYQPTSAELVAAQLEADRNRRSVTTRSFDVPATAEHWTDRLRYGADGLPGVPGVDDDGNGLVDDSADYLFVANADGAGVEQLYNDGCDDYRVILGADPPEQARLI